MKFILTITFLFFVHLSFAQTFTRSELPTSLTTPWEIVYGPDNYLWLTEAGGKVIRVNPNTGTKQVIYTANDYFGGDPSETNQYCTNLAIGKGTLGLALHPDFSDSSKAYLYFVYTYNSGTAPAPATKFRIKRLKWNAMTETVVADTNIVNQISNGYDHWGGRLLAVKQNNIPYLFYALGDLGRSEENDPTCYQPQSLNPNNLAQDINSQNGKIHRFNMDGSIPADNPVAGNSFYTRGHRNPQGLIYNSSLGLIYDVEHGDRTDDEINVLHKGMNYGWKDVRGYANDNSYPTEAAYAAAYVPNPSVPNDSLVDPLWAWCTTLSPSGNYLDWCTVAPSGGDYYGYNTIPQWSNSLLVVTLKDGQSTDKELFQFKLQSNGELAPSTPGDPNPKKFFGGDQALNGRLRDLAISSDGMKIFLINNGGATDKITVYTYDTTTSIQTILPTEDILSLYPNPAENFIHIKGLEKLPNVVAFQLTTLVGQEKKALWLSQNQLDIHNLEAGMYFLTVITEESRYVLKFLKSQ